MPETHHLFLAIFFLTSVLRASEKRSVKFYSPRAEFFVLFLSQLFLWKNSIFLWSMAFQLFIAKLSQLIILSSDGTIAKMFLLPSVSWNYDSPCKYEPNTKRWLGRKGWGPYECDATRRESSGCGEVGWLHSAPGRWLQTASSIAFSSLQGKRAITVWFHLYCSVIQAINAN